MPKPGQTRADAGEAKTRAQERVVPHLRPIVAKGEGRRSELIFKVGDRVAHSFKRYDGSFHEDVGTSRGFGEKCLTQLTSTKTTAVVSGRVLKISCC
jgi:hypothetical protein